MSCNHFRFNGMARAGRPKEITSLSPLNHFLPSVQFASITWMAAQRRCRSTPAETRQYMFLSLRGFAKGVSQTMSPRFFLFLKMKQKKPEENGKKKK